MGNLGGILGNLYGGDDGEDDDASTAVPPTPTESADRPAAARDEPSTPSWADDDRLDAAFADWNPGPSPDAPAHEREMFEPASPPADLDMEAALQAALAAAVAAADDPMAVPPAPPAEPAAEPENFARYEPEHFEDRPPPTLAPATPSPPSQIAAALDQRPEFDDDYVAAAGAAAAAIDPFDALFEPEPSASPAEAPVEAYDTSFDNEPEAPPPADPSHDTDAGPQVDPAWAAASLAAVTVPPPITAPADPYDIPARRETWVRGADDVLPSKGRRKKK